MFQNFIFDWSGTLNDNFHAFYEVVCKVFQHSGKEPISKEEVRRYITIPYMKFWNRYFPDRTRKEQVEIYNEFVHTATEAFVFPEVPALLRSLHGQGKKLFILSSDPYSMLLPEIKNAGIFDLFTNIDGEVHDKEPSLIKLLDTHNLERDKTVFIGDTSGDVEAGKSVGISTVGITWGHQAKEVLAKSKPDFLINNIRELEHLLIDREVEK